MKTLWLENRLDYDGSQLAPLFAYRTTGLLGPSCVVFRGACNVLIEKMVDLEDVRAKAEIRGSDMVHLILEMFDRDLFGAVSFQRIVADLARSTVFELSSGRVSLRRDGDDLYLDRRKFSISIATASPVSQMIHFAVNAKNEGTPVLTCALEDFDIQPEVFGRTLMAKIMHEFQSITEATQKVRPI